MPQVKQFPSSMKLAPTLAQRLCQLRELRNMTSRDLAHIARFAQKRIEDIESGLETWLSVADRQRLAKALAVEPALLQEVEFRGKPDTFEQLLAEKKVIEAAVLRGARDLACPCCGGLLKSSIQDGLDMDGYPVKLAKAFCTKCPFVLS